MPPFPTNSRLVMTWDFSPQFLIQGIDQDCARLYLRGFPDSRRQVVAGVVEEGCGGGV